MKNKTADEADPKVAYFLVSPSGDLINIKMKKRNQVFILISLTVLFSCTNVKRSTQKEDAKSNAKVISTNPVPKVEKVGQDSSKARKDGDTVSYINYSFFNDTICQTLSIKKISKNEKLKIPERLKFKFLLHDKQHKYDDKIFEGIAQLFSSEESFSDNSEKDGGAYDAADYSFKATDYEIQIRLDIQSYEACVVQITTGQPDIVLGGYRAYLKKFPNDGVMKRGECK
jgi:hypothetical protein